jgi:hypothetical protein
MPQTVSFRCQDHFLRLLGPLKVARSTGGANSGAAGGVATGTDGRGCGVETADAIGTARGTAAPADWAPGAGRTGEPGLAGEVARPAGGGFELPGSARNWKTVPQRGHDKEAVPVSEPGGNTYVQVGLGQGNPGVISGAHGTGATRQSSIRPF